MNPRRWFRVSGSFASALLFVSCASVLLTSTIQAQAPTTAVGTKSATQTATVTITTAGTLHSISVLTQGSTTLDYQEVLPDGGTCTAGTAFAIGDTCTVQYTFTPTRPWLRYGGIAMFDASGNLLGNLFLTGTGTGPQVSYPITTATVPTALGSGYSGPEGAAVDGNGDVYTATSAQSVIEIVAVAGAIPANPTVKTLLTGLSSPSGVAVDGSGNVYVADLVHGLVKEIVAVNGAIPASPTVLILGSGFTNPAGVAVDGSGNVFVADATDKKVKEILAVNGVIPATPTIRTLGSGFSGPWALALDASGDVFVADGSAGVKEMIAVAGSIPAVNPTINTLGSGLGDVLGIAVDPFGNVYVDDASTQVLKELVAVSGVVPATNPTILTLSTGFNTLSGLAIDANGNLFVADGGGNAVDELNAQTPPTVSFASTSVGVASSSNPQTATVENNGNTPLTFAVPGAGSNPATTAGFSLSPSSTCPILNSSSVTTASLDSGLTCTEILSFTPVSAGSPVTGTSTATDDNLNAASATQAITLSGTATPGTLGVSVASPSVTVGTTSVALSATVSFPGVAPTGAVTFKVNGGTAIAATCITNTSSLACSASYDPSSLTVNSYTIDASVAADGNYSLSSGSGSLTITKGTPSLVLSASGAAAVDGTLTFKVAITPNTGITPAGAVTFTSTVGGVTTAITGCSSVSPVSAAGPPATLTATCPSSLGAGSYTIGASIASDTNFITANSNSLSETVSTVTPTLTFTAGSTGSSNVNDSAAFTVQITPNTGITPTGKVTFSNTFNGTTTAITGCTSVSPVSVAGPPATLTATCTTTALQAGSNSISATIASDSNFKTANTSVSATQTVSTVTPTLTFTAGSTGSSNVNSSATFTVQVTPATGITPTGKVTFSNTFNGTTTPIATCTSVSLVSAAGPPATLTATCTTTALAAGSNSVSASIASDSNFKAATTSTPATQTVSTVAPALTLTSSGTFTVDGPVSFTVAVTPNTGITPTGKVSLSTTLNGTTTPIAACTSLVPVSAAGPPATLTAACSTSALQAGANTITASITSDTNFTAANSNSLTPTVTQATTTLGLVSSSVPSPPTSTVNTPVTFTATVAATAAFTTTPTGTVSFTAGGTVIPGCGAVSVDSTTHAASCTANALVAPSDVIVATYTGDANFKTSTSPQVTQIVNKNTPVNTISSSLQTTAVVNQTVTFTSTITPNLSSSLGVAPIGSVTFTNGSGGPNLCPPVVVTKNANGTGTATCSVPFTSASTSLNIFAVYSGDQNFTAGNSPSVAQTVLPQTATTTVISQTNPSVVNDSVTLIATVTPTNTGAGYPGTATPQSGTLTFSDSLVAGTFCPTTISGGVLTPATCSHIFTSSGNHVVTAAFISSDANFLKSTTATEISVTQLVGTSSTTLTVSNANSTSETVNQSATFAATFPAFAPGAAVPQGTVAYSDSLATTNPICTVNVSSTGAVPNCSETLLVAGTHVITAVFTSTNTNFGTINSQNFVQVVGQNTTAVVLTSPSTSSSTVDQVLTFTATVTPSTLTPAAVGTTNPTGLVTFAYVLNGATTTICSPSVSTTAGVTSATCSAALPAAGSYAITATYAGDANFKTNASTSHSQIVGKTGTSLSLIGGATLSSPPSPAVNQSALYSVQVSLTGGISDTGLTAPTGNVTFTDTATSVTCSAVVSPSGQASCSLTEPTAGPHTISATYSGDSNFSTSTSTPSFSVTIAMDGTSVQAVTVTPTNPAVDQSTTLNATVTPANSGTTIPTGTVTFSDAIAGSATTTCVSTISAGVVPACTHLFTTAGTHTLKAIYSGDTNFSSNSATISVSVGQAGGTTITVATTTPTVVVNQAATFTATFSPLTGALPQGTVSYSDSLSTANPVCSKLAVTATGTIPNCTETMLVAGAHNITATFTPAAGNTNFPSITSAIFTQVVNPDTYTVSVASSSPGNSSSVDQPVILTSTVTPTALTPPAVGTTSPTGTITFGAVSGGVSNVLCTGQLAPSTGGSATASCTPTFTAPGSYVITATYANDTNFIATASFPSSSTSVTQIVSKAATTVTVTLPTPAPAVNASAVYSAQISLAGSITDTAPLDAVPTGSVTFSDSVTGATCTATLVTSGQASCSFAEPTSGTHNIVAAYSGDSNFSASSSSVPEIVGLTTPIITVTSSNPNAPALNPVTFTASITATGGNTPTNLNSPGIAFTVIQGGQTFNCNPYTGPSLTATTGGADQATCTVIFPANVSGAITVSAKYYGDNNYTAVTGSLTGTQNVQTFVPTVTPAQITMAQGSSTKANTNFADAFSPSTIQLAWASEGGFPTQAASPTAVALTSCLVTPATSGLTCAPNTPSATTPGVAVVTATSAVPPGVYTVTYTVVDQANPLLIQTTSSTLTILSQAAPVFSPTSGITVTPATFSLPASFGAPLGSTLACDSKVATSNSDGTYTLGSDTLTGIDIACSAIAGPSASGSYTFTITAGNNSTSAKLEGHPTSGGISAALLGAPFLLLMGLLPASRKHRKALLRTLGVAFLAVVTLHVTGCGGGGFTRTPPQTAIPGSYLIGIVNAQGQIVAEVPLIIAN